MAYDVYPRFPVPTNWGEKKVSWGTSLSQGWETGKTLARSTWSSPLREITMDYALVSDEVGEELAALYGFFMAQKGSFKRFLFSPFYVGQFGADHMVQGAALGVGDGETAAFQVIRSIGPYTEIIRFLDPLPPYYRYGEGGYGEHGYGGAGEQSTGREPPYLYIDGVMQYEGYDWTETGEITLAAPPPPGAILTLDYNYFYLCRFKADDFGLALKGFGPRAVWELAKVVLAEVRP